MKQKLPKALALTILLMLTSCLCPQCLSDGYLLSYKLLDAPDGSVEYRLNVAVSQSLYEYYREQNHKLVSVDDFAKFVTPYALKPIADKLAEIYQGEDENFANGVLMIVHQIPYNSTDRAKYPVETIVENSGDCDMLSYIAASILKAGGLDVVLLYYENKAHMNIGVSLSRTPRDARTPASYVTYSGVRYYIAECTGEGLENGWRVGECPSDLRYEEAQIITLEKCEHSAPGQVSASYKSLAFSTITFVTSSTFVFQENTVSLSGQLSPAIKNAPVTIYVKTNTSPWTPSATVTTDSNGRFAYFLNVNGANIYYVRASWSGNEEYIGADSSLVSITVISPILITFLTIAVTLICISAVLFLVKRKKFLDIEDSSVPSIPSL